MMKLTDGWRHWWKLNSAQVMAFWSILGGVVIAAWPVMHWFLDTVIPDEGPWRWAMALGVAAVTFSSFFVARFRQQPKLQEAKDADVSA